MMMAPAYQPLRWNGTALKVLQIIPELEAGGAERTTIDVAEALTAAGGTALVASLGGRLEDELEAVGGQLVRMDVKTKNPATILANAAAIAALAAREGVDIIHARSRAPAWSGLWAARKASRPFVTTYHGTYNARSGLKRLYNSVMARGDVVIANSRFIAEHVKAEHGRVLARKRADLSHLHVIPRGVDLSAFDPHARGKERAAALRQIWLEGREGALVLLPARLTSWKGQALAIEAIHLLMQRVAGPLPTLVCAGDAQGREAYVAELRAQAARLGVALVLPGHVSDMASAYAAADIVINPSIEPEAFGRTLVEAMAMERPVIAAAHGGPVEILADSRAGRLVPAGSAPALAQALAEILALDSAERKLRGQFARQHAIAHYSKQALQSATLRVYGELLH